MVLIDPIIVSRPDFDGLKVREECCLVIEAPVWMECLYFMLFSHSKGLTASLKLLVYFRGLLPST